MRSFELLVIATAVACWKATLAFAPNPSHQRNRWSKPLSMGLDYNDPMVAEEFANVQTMTYEEVEDELKKSGIPYSQSMKYVVSVFLTTIL